MTTASLSFEYFPPRDEEARIRLNGVHQRLSALQPEYISVTYGAGGSTRDATSKLVEDLTSQSTIEVAPHLSFGIDDAETVGAIIDRYKSLGIRRLIALRGDLPAGKNDSTSLPHANEMVRFIRDRTGAHFDIGVACHPEMHPQALSFDSDIQYLKQKLDAGANRAVTQYFSDAYFYFLDACSHAGIEQPIYPGIMPIGSLKSLLRFSSSCGAEVPRWLRCRLASFGEDESALADCGIEIVSRLSEKLLEGGAPGLHFYTLNRCSPTLEICQNLGFGGHEDSAVVNGN